MAIITIARGSYVYGEAIAEKVADKLGYTRLAREVLIEASGEYNIPEVKLTNSFEGVSSFMDGVTRRKEKYTAYIRATLFRSLQKDNVVYHGFAGQVFVQEIPHALKVRITAKPEIRAQSVMERNGISKDEARRFVTNIDARRRDWSLSMYGVDSSDSKLYDLVIHVDKLTVDDAADLIVHTVGLEQFQTTPASQAMVDDLALAAQVEAAIVEVTSEFEVSVKDGVVRLKSNAPEYREFDELEEVKEIAQRVSGVTKIIDTLSS